jgi:DNA-binding PadR family transcriptional regulator
VVELSSLSRFSDPSVLILSSLAEMPRHGHAVYLDIKGFAGVELGPGTLYGAIARLEERGLIEAVGEDGRRRTYRLTAKGADALRAYLSHAAGVADVGLRRLATA